MIAISFSERHFELASSKDHHEWLPQSNEPILNLQPQTVKLLLQL